jgi:hypothetical protein
VHNLNPFIYVTAGSETIEGGQKVRLFRFKNDYKQKVIVEIFQFKFNVYALKFYLHNHRDSENRYSFNYDIRFLKRKKITGARNFLRTVDTITTIALKEILDKDIIASFGFLGAPKPAEKDPNTNSKNINTDRTIANTIRYRIYNISSRKIFNPENFEYIDSKTSSIMLLRNNKNKEKLTVESAENYIKKEIIPNL